MGIRALPLLHPARNQTTAWGCGFPRRRMRRWRPSRTARTTVPLPDPQTPGPPDPRTSGPPDLPGPWTKEPGQIFRIPEVVWICLEWFWIWNLLNPGSDREGVSQSKPPSGKQTKNPPRKGSQGLSFDRIRILGTRMISTCSTSRRAAQ